MTEEDKKEALELLNEVGNMLSNPSPDNLKRLREIQAIARKKHKESLKELQESFKEKQRQYEDKDGKRSTAH